MNTPKSLKIYLILSGLLLSFIGGATLLFPVMMKGSAGIDIANNVSVINDIRAGSALILAVAIISLVGAFSKSMRYTAAVMSFVLFLALGIGRLLSILQDGMPVDGLVKATILEFVLGLVGLLLFTKHKSKL